MKGNNTMNKEMIKDLMIEAIYRYVSEHAGEIGIFAGTEEVANDIANRLVNNCTITEPTTNSKTGETLVPLKIEIERNIDAVKQIKSFFVTINGKKLENVKRFYIDLDEAKLITENGTHFEPITYGVEYYEDPDFDVLHIMKNG